MTKDDEIDRLISLYCDNLLGTEDLRDLEIRLQSDPLARKRFWEFTRTHSLLFESESATQIDATSFVDAALAIQAEDNAVSRDKAEDRATDSKRFARLRRTNVALIAGLISLAASLFVAFRWTPNTESSIGVVSHQRFASARLGGQEIGVGDGVPAGRLELSGGSMAITLVNGVRLGVAGETSLDIVNKNRCFLRSGTVTADVPPQAIGFRIESHQLNVIDLGTRFGVFVDEESAEVHVIEGEVETQVVGDDETKRLLAAQATRVNGANVSQTDFDPQRYAEILPELSTMKVDGAVQVLSQPPRSLRNRRFEHDFIVAFEETRQPVRLTDQVAVTFATSGKYATQKYSRGREIIPAGRTVRSVYVHYDPPGRDVLRRQGTIQFDREIIGVIANYLLIETTNSLFQVDDTEYPTPDNGRPRQTLELADTLQISDDRRTLSIDFSAGRLSDQIRVLVDAKPDETEDEVEN